MVLWKSYNIFAQSHSFVEHLKKAIKILIKKKKRSHIGLDYILQNYSHAHIGFASQNFYSEFLALVHVLAYKNRIYPLDGIRTNLNFTDPENFKIYATKQKFRPKKFFRLMKKTSPYIVFLNTHLIHIGDVYPKGTLIVSDKVLNSKKYKLVKEETLLKRFPKNFHK